MKRWLYLAGRAFQLAGLITLPSAIWVGHFDRDEKSAVAILVAAIVIFTLGYLLTRLSSGR